MGSELRDFLKYNIENTVIYEPCQTMEVCELLMKQKFMKCCKKRNGPYLYNIPCSFDIETSSFYKDGQKVGIMYVWQMSICGLVIIGRTWEEWLECLKILSIGLDLNPGERHLVVYVHNLAYEFQFCRLWLEWLEVFAVDNRKPVHATSSLGIEFKCSYVLSAFSLAKVGEHLTEIPVEKTEGLEYYELRNSKSDLSWEEVRYMVNDVQVVVSFIYEEMLRNGNIGKIPLTNTGYVRAFCRRACFQGFDNNPKRRKYVRFNYMNFIHSLTLTEDEYKQARRAFGGGFTHCDPFYSGIEMYCVDSFDFCSAYPAKAVTEKIFPMSHGEMVEDITKEEFEKSVNLYFCMFDVVFEDLESTFLYDNYLSVSHCWTREGVTTSNGRVVRGRTVGTTITNIDFEVIRRTYKWKSMKVARLRRYKRGYLPTNLVKAILSLYADKTELKGIKEKIVEYMQKKGMANATYGMICQAIFKDNSVYNGTEWDVEEANAEEELEKYNTSKNRFLFYLWALVITASCRRDLWSAIMEFGSDYIYADTDSVKVINSEKHMKYINRYNNHVMSMIENASRFHGIPIEKFMPRTIKGEVKPIGLWEKDASYMRFLSIGAKRYLVEYWDGHQELTVSGLNKKKTLAYMEDAFGTNTFENFTDKLYIPPGHTGKLIHTYIDAERKGVLTDFRGIEAPYYEKSSVHLEEGDYSLSISEEYKEYIILVQTK